MGGYNGGLAGWGSGSITKVGGDVVIGSHWENQGGR